MTIIIAMSLVSVAACLVTLSRVVGWRRILRHATLVDVCFTIGLMAFFAGTLTGALVAVLGGLIMALVLTGLKAAVSYADRAVSAVSRSGVCPAGCDPTEYDADGNWIYNQRPYI